MVQALRVLQQYAVPVCVQQLDQIADGAQLQGVLKKHYKHYTVPCIFIDRQVPVLHALACFTCMYTVACLLVSHCTISAESWSHLTVTQVDWPGISTSAHGRMAGHATS